jgi:hypothetical protein
MIQVKLFVETSVTALENSVNAWLDREMIMSSQLVSVQMTGFVVDEGVANNFRYVVLVTYKTV